MSFNPPPNNGPPHGQPGRGNPMLPPQLANLTPQQLQQLRNQPQFQKIMRSYLQRQQMLQSQMGGPNVPPQAAPPMPMHAPPAMVPPQGMVAPPAAPNVPKPYQEPPPPSNGVPSEIMSRIPMTQMAAADEWSKKLEAEGKPVPTELKVYENIIANESRFMSRNARQNEANKKITEGLLKDVRSYNEVKQLRMNAIALSSKGQFNNSIWGEGYQGYGNGVTNTATQLVLPHQRKRFTKAPESLRTEREQNEKLLARLKSSPNRSLVPVRLEFDSERDRFKLRDTFLWDTSEDEAALEAFVTSLLEDYKIIPPHHVATVLASVKEQIKNFHQKPEKSMGELRVPIKIDVTINNTQLTDQFEWDILNSADNDPEEFAQVFCDEMQLPGEFATAIAHSIREQTHMFHKSLFLVGYSFDGSAVTEDEIRTHILPSLRPTSQDYSRDFGALLDDYYSILRNPSNVPDYTPTLIKLTQVELERLDKEIEREARRKRRHNANEDFGSGRGSGRRGVSHNARGGPVLPDLTDIPKTFRTPQPSSVLPGGIDLFVPNIHNYNEVIVHRTQVADRDRQSRKPRVIYNHDPMSGRFFVKIRTRV